MIISLTNTCVCMDACLEEIIVICVTILIGILLVGLFTLLVINKIIKGRYLKSLSEKFDYENEVALLKSELGKK